MNSVNTSTKRTGVNIMVITAFMALIARIFNAEWTINPEDLALLSPVFGAIAAIGYRLSRVLTTKFPQLGYVLFGSGKEPAGIKRIGE